MTTDDRAVDFLIDEVIRLREEIVFYLNQIEVNERFILIISGSIWALIASVEWNDAWVL